jgi:hypothetical protein
MPGWAPAAGIAALIIAAGIYAFFPRKDALPKTTPLPAADIAPRVTPALSQTPEPIRVEEPIQPQPAQTQPEPEPRPADPPPPARAPLTVDIRVTAASWIQIYTDGTPTEAGVLEPGATRHYSAQKTINMVVGNAGGLSLTVNDREISPLGKSGEVRQFTITPENAAQLKSSAPGN